MQSWLPKICGVLAFVLFCAVLTYWIIALTSHGNPAPTAQTAAPPAIALNAAPRLLGGDRSENHQVQLAGILSLGPGHAAAILSTQGGIPHTLTVGQHLEGAGVLKEIHARSVLVEDQGATTEVFLPATSGPTIYLRSKPAHP